MSSFPPFEDQPIIRSRVRGRAGRLPSEVRLFIWLGIIVFLGVIAYFSHRWVYIPYVVKPREFEQRKLYDRYMNASKGPFDLGYTPKPDEDEATRARNEARHNARHTQAVREARSEAKALDAECRKNWGVGPEEFRNLPETSDPYFKDVR